MTMRLKYVVIDCDEECPTMDEKSETFELFGLEKTAMTRAQKAAKNRPGVTFMVCEAIADVTCAVGQPAVTRLKVR